jgi:hypothetical protein
MVIAQCEEVPTQRSGVWLWRDISYTDVAIRQSWQLAWQHPQQWLYSTEVPASRSGEMVAEMCTPKKNTHYPNARVEILHYHMKQTFMRHRATLSYQCLLFMSMVWDYVSNRGHQRAYCSSPGDICVWRTMVDWYRQGKTPDSPARAHRKFYQQSSSSVAWGTWRRKCWSLTTKYLFHTRKGL